MSVVGPRLRSNKLTNTVKQSVEEPGISLVSSVVRHSLGLITKITMSA